MYFWNVHGLAEYLQNKHLILFNLLLYFTFLLVTLVIGINVLTLLPHLYSLVMTSSKIYLEEQVKPAALQIRVFHHMNDVFLLINLLLLASGLFFCFIIHHGTIKQFVSRVVALSWLITFRLIVISTILFCVVAGIFGSYFLYKLLLISKAEGPKGPLPFRPLKYIFKLTGTYPLAKSLWTQAHALPKAQKVFDQINVVSLYAYWICQFGTVFSTMWWVLILQEKLRFINKSN